jgi:hypothetical protein
LLIDQTLLELGNRRHTDQDQLNANLITHHQAQYYAFKR